MEEGEGEEESEGDGLKESETRIGMRCIPGAFLVQLVEWRLGWRDLPVIVFNVFCYVAYALQLDSALSLGVPWDWGITTSFEILDSVVNDSYAVLSKAKRNRVGRVNITLKEMLCVAAKSDACDA